MDLHIGTLSKAFGCQGGFVACSARWKDFLVNRGRTQVFSTVLPVPTVAAAHAALRVAAQVGRCSAMVHILSLRTLRRRTVHVDGRGFE